MPVSVGRTPCWRRQSDKAQQSLAGADAMKAAHPGRESGEFMSVPAGGSAPHRTDRDAEPTAPPRAPAQPKSRAGRCRWDRKARSPSFAPIDPCVQPPQPVGAVIAALSFRLTRELNPDLEIANLLGRPDLRRWRRDGRRRCAGPKIVRNGHRCWLTRTGPPERARRPAWRPGSLMPRVAHLCPSPEAQAAQYPFLPRHVAGKHIDAGG